MAAAPAPAKTLGDDVASLVKWQDAVRREQRIAAAHSKNCPVKAEFTLSKKLQSISGKIGTSDGIHWTPEVTARKEEDVTALKKVLAESSKTPRERYSRPMTDSQRVGWFASRAAEFGGPIKPKL